MGKDFRPPGALWREKERYGGQHFTNIKIWRPTEKIKMTKM